MRFILTGFVLILMIWACVPEKLQNAEQQEMSLPDQSIMDPLNDLSTIQYKFSDIKLYQPISAFQASHFKKYGNFYSSNFAIYCINDLNALYENQEIAEIYLYFVDSVLLKIQAHTTRNLTSELIEKYKGGKLIPKDEFNKVVTKSESILTRKNGRIVINDKLNNYKIRWKNEDVLITYAVNENIPSGDSSDPLTYPTLLMPHYVFTFESATYQQELHDKKLNQMYKKELLVYEHN